MPSASLGSVAILTWVSHDLAQLPGQPGRAFLQFGHDGRQGRGSRAVLVGGGPGHRPTAVPGLAGVPVERLRTRLAGSPAIVAASGTVRSATPGILAAWGMSG